MPLIAQGLLWGKQRGVVLYLVKSISVLAILHDKPIQVHWKLSCRVAYVSLEKQECKRGHFRSSVFCDRRGLRFLLTCLYLSKSDTLKEKENPPLKAQHGNWNIGREQLCGPVSSSSTVHSESGKIQSLDFFFLVDFTIMLNKLEKQCFI